MLVGRRLHNALLHAVGVRCPVSVQHAPRRPVRSPPMSDTKLRELERRWKETGSISDEAACLLERVRVGDLTRERLELAAYCGHSAACAALAVPPQTSACARAWLSILHQRDPSAALRAGIVLTRLALPTWELTHPGDLRPVLALKAAEGVLRGDPDSVEQARSASDAAHDAAVETESSGYDSVAASCAAALADHAAGAFGDLITVLECAEAALEPEAPDLLSTMRSELISWALGGDA